MYYVCIMHFTVLIHLILQYLCKKDLIYDFNVE